jgi:predicted transcriptional regulator
VNKDPKGYAKPVKLSDLKKVLRKDPDYFNH